MEKEKNVSGYRTRIVNVRLTEVEYEKFQCLMKNNCDENVIASDFIRQRLLADSDDRFYRKLYFEVKKMRTELAQAVKRIELYENEAAFMNLSKMVEQCTNKLTEIFEMMNEVSADGDNNT